MHRGTVIWTAGIGPLIVLDVVLDKRHDGSTLSEATRYVFHTDRRWGRNLFTATLIGGTIWLRQHICRPPT